MRAQIWALSSLLLLMAAGAAHAQFAASVNGGSQPAVGGTAFATRRAPARKEYKDLEVSSDDTASDDAEGDALKASKRAAMRASGAKGAAAPEQKQEAPAAKKPDAAPAAANAAPVKTPAAVPLKEAPKKDAAPAAAAAAAAPKPADAPKQPAANSTLPTAKAAAKPAAPANATAVAAPANTTAGALKLESAPVKATLAANATAALAANATAAPAANVTAAPAANATAAPAANTTATPVSPAAPLPAPPAQGDNALNCSRFMPGCNRCVYTPPARQVRPASAYLDAMAMPAAPTRRLQSDGAKATVGPNHSKAGGASTTSRGAKSGASSGGDQGADGGADSAYKAEIQRHTQDIAREFQQRSYMQPSGFKCLDCEKTKGYKLNAALGRCGEL
jgi:hypothetical protein